MAEPQMSAVEELHGELYFCQDYLGELHRHPLGSAPDALTEISTSVAALGLDTSSISDVRGIPGRVAKARDDALRLLQEIKHCGTVLQKYMNSL